MCVDIQTVLVIALTADILGMMTVLRLAMKAR